MFNNSCSLIAIFILLTLKSYASENPKDETFRVGLANIYFFANLIENNVKNPPFKKPHKNPPDEQIEKEFDRLSLEYLSRYIRYLDADVLILCEAPSDLSQLEEFVSTYLDSDFDVIHNSPVVRDKTYYYDQQIAALVRKNLFKIRRYEALSQDSVEDLNQLYPYPSSSSVQIPSSSSVQMAGETMTVYWSRFPIEFDLALKTDSEHWYKIIATYPKSKASKGKLDAVKARLKNFEQQRLIRSRIESVSQSFEDIIILGDMNDSLGMDPVEKELGIDSLMALFKGDQDPILWNPIKFPQGEGTYIYKNNPEVIDFIFLTHGLKLGKGWTSEKQYEYFHFFKTMVRQKLPAKPDRLEHRELFISDHAPVTIDINHNRRK